QLLAAHLQRLADAGLLRLRVLLHKIGLLRTRLRLFDFLLAAFLLLGVMAGRQGLAAMPADLRALERLEIAKSGASALQQRPLLDGFAVRLLPLPRCGFQLLLQRLLLLAELI